MTAVTTRFYTSMAAAFGQVLTRIVVLCWLLLASKVEIYSFMAGSERCRRCEIRRQLYNGTYSLPGIQARIKCIQLIVHVRRSKSNVVTRSTAFSAAIISFHGGDFDVLLWRK